jgi:signal transduction histidine kinase
MEPGMWRSSVEERFLFAGARLRVIRLAVWVGWASLAAIAVTTVVHTRHSEYAGHLEIWALLAAAALAQAGAYLVPWRRLAGARVTEYLLYGWVAAVLVFIGVLLYLAGPATSDYYLVYLLLVLFAAAALPPRVYLVVVVVALASYLGIASTTSSVRDLIIPMTAILLLSALAGQLASEQRARAREIARLHQAMLALAAEPRLAALQTALVGWARRLIGASQAALVAVHGGDAVVDPAGVGPDLAGLPVQEAAGVPGTVLVGRDRQGQQALLVGVKGSAWVLVLWGAEAGSSTGQYLLETLVAQAAGSLETARLHQALGRKERARAALVGRLMGAQEEERRRIARELHDGVGQDLAGLVVGLEALERSPGTIEVAELKRLARSTAQQIRELIVDLRPRVLDDLGLGAALRWLTQERHPNLQVELDVALDRQLPSPVETALFRIVQEALTNVDRHALAGAARLRVWTTNGQIRAVVEDNGRGFDPQREAGGFGIVGMRERAEQLGGRVQVTSDIAAGTRVEAVLPLEG